MHIDDARIRCGFQIGLDIALNPKDTVQLTININGRAEVLLISRYLIEHDGIVTLADCRISSNGQVIILGIGCRGIYPNSTFDSAVLNGQITAVKICAAAHGLAVQVNGHLGICGHILNATEVREGAARNGNLAIDSTIGLIATFNRLKAIRSIIVVFGHHTIENTINNFCLCLRSRP